MRHLATATLLAAVCCPFTLAQPAGEKPKEAPKPKAYPDKHIHVPTPLPDRVILTWSGDTTTTQSVTWRTDTTVASAVGQITESAAGPSFDPAWGGKADAVRTVPAVTEFLATDLNDCHCHSVTFRGLKPQTKYLYRVGAAPNWSEWFQFETASDKAEPFGFIYVGDAQEDIKRHWSRLIRQAHADMPKAKFVLHAGDLITRSNSDGQWGEWHAAAGWINGSIPSVPSPGNHEYGAPPKTAVELTDDGLGAAVGGVIPKSPSRPSVVTPHWRAQFTLPDHGPAGLEETCYYLDIQGVRLICLNSMEKIEAQVPWLENVLRTNPNKWTIVTFHVPVYSTAASRQTREETKPVRAKWRPIFDKYGVDLVLQGHDHCYGRSGLLRNDAILANGEEYDRKGSVYVVSVSGPKLYPVGTMPWMVTNAERMQLYQLVRIDGDRLHFETRTADGGLFDEFELRKKPDGRSELVERAGLAAERDSPGGPVGREVLFALGGMGVLAGGYAGVRALRGKPAA